MVRSESRILKEITGELNPIKPLLVAMVRSESRILKVQPRRFAHGDDTP